MYKLIVLLVSLLTTSAVYAEKCNIELLEEIEYTDIECQFYMGTQAYRNQVYSVAAAHWEYVTKAESQFEGDDSLKATALSTLTFLYYQGLGVKENKSLAVNNWKEAVKKGDFEARRHLGFAYSDPAYKQKDAIKALGWYESIFMVAEKFDELDESDKNVYSDALDAAEKLRTQLSVEERSQSLEFARSTL